LVYVSVDKAELYEPPPAPPPAPPGRSLFLPHALASHTRRYPQPLATTTTASIACDRGRLPAFRRILQCQPPCRLSWRQSLDRSHQRWTHRHVIMEPSSLPSGSHDGCSSASSDNLASGATVLLPLGSPVCLSSSASSGYLASGCSFSPPLQFRLWILQCDFWQLREQ